MIRVFAPQPAVDLIVLNVSQRPKATAGIQAHGSGNRWDYINRKQAKACGVKLYHLVNVGNHLHMVVKIEDRKLYRNFIRSVSGLIARQFLQKQRGPEKTEAIEAAVVAKKFTKLLACKAHHSDRFVGP